MFSIKPKSFVYTIFIMLFLLSVTYVVLYLIQIERTSFGLHSYKDFLIKATKKYPRIIIDSGSNSTHSIDSMMMEKEFHKVVINIADNGSYPLKQKLFRIQRFAHRGDVVLLPLEFSYYSNINISDIFYNNIFGSLNFYFEPMPWIDKLDFIAHTPLSPLAKSFFIVPKRQNNLAVFVDQFNNRKRGDHEFIHKGTMDESSSMSCEDYIFFTNKMYDFDISETFKDDARMIKEIERETGIRFVFTYPAVVGNNCYNGKYHDKYIRMMAQVIKLLHSYNIPFIGKAEESLFGKEYMDNTYYHVLPSARVIRTTKLIQTIKDSPYSTWFQSKNKLINPHLNILSLIDYSSLSVLTPDQEYLISHTEDVLCLKGWFPRENWGVWNSSKSSTILLKVDKSKIKQHMILTLRSRIFGQKELTSIELNGFHVGSYILDGSVKINIPKKAITDETVIVKFSNTNLQSPKELGVGNDQRKFKIGLESLSIHYE